MLTSHRFVKTIATTLLGALAAYAVATGLAEGNAHAQISGTIGGDVVGRRLIEEEGIFFEVPPNGGELITADALADAWTDGTSDDVSVKYTLFQDAGVSRYSVTLEGARRLRIAADVTTADPAGGTRTERIIAIVIGLLAPQAPGFMDYTDDACMLADAGAPGDAELRACAFVSRTFRAFMQGRRLAVSPHAVMAQTPAGIAIWEPR